MTAKGIGHSEVRLGELAAALVSLREAVGGLGPVELPMRGGLSSHDSSSLAERLASAVGQEVAKQSGDACALVAAMASPLALAAADDQRWLGDAGFCQGRAEVVRVGALGGERGLDVPGVIPVRASAGCWVHRSEREYSHSIVESIILRLLADAAPYRLRVDAFDPSMTGTLGVFMPITAAFPQIISHSSSRLSDFRTALDAILALSAERASRMAQAAVSHFADIAEESAEPVRVVVLLDYPTGIDEGVHRDLIRLAQSGSHRGLWFLVDVNRQAQVESGVHPNDFLGLLDGLSLTGNSVVLSRHPSLGFTPDLQFSSHVFANVCTQVKNHARAASLSTIPFLSTMPDSQQWWTAAGDHLSVPIGRADRRPVQLRLRSENPALPNVLIGGAVGQGKSNLLLVIIHALAVYYSPRDVQMYLLDFKHGVEFDVLGPDAEGQGALPHARVLGVHSDREFGLAVLRHIADHIVERGAYFKENGNVTDISQLPAGRPPRLVVILDEFQVLFEDDDQISDESLGLLEKIAKTGRAFGIHLILATQTTSGMSRLAMKKDSIFGQVPYRIALKTTQQNSQEILGNFNTAAADLQFRGEAIFNENWGEASDNQKMLVSFADRQELQGLRQQLWVKAEGAGLARLPRIFKLAEPAELPKVLAEQPPVRATPPQAWLGLPIAVNNDPVAVSLLPEPGSGMLVLGDGPEQALGLLSAAAISVARAAASPVDFVILDGTHNNPQLTTAKQSLVRVLSQEGCGVELVADTADIFARIRRLGEAIFARSVSRPTYVIGLGFHGIPGISRQDEQTFDSAADVLRKVVEDGPAENVITLGWWNRMHICQQHLGYDLGNVATQVFLKHPEDAVKSVCGPFSKWSSPDFRALLWDGMGTDPITFVPFAALTREGADQIIEKWKEKS